MQPDFSKIFETAELLPCLVNEEENLISFMQMSDNAYRNSSFLDGRAKVDQYFTTSIDKLLGKYNSVRPVLVSYPTHFIFYNGYCGSTLLSRLLHELPGCHVTKEPVITYWLGEAKIDKRIQKSNTRRDTVNMLYFMLTRQWMDSEAMFVKVPSVNTILAEDLLNLNPFNTGFYLYAGKKEFLISYLKKKPRRLEARRFYEILIRFVRQTSFLDPPLPDVATDKISDAHCVATLWIIYSALYTRLLDRFTSDRIFCCESQEFFQSPERILKIVTEKTEMQISDDSIRAITGGRVSKTYSKNPDKEYSLDIRQAEMKEQYAKNKSEIDSGMLFISSYEERMSQPFYFNSVLT